MCVENGDQDLLLRTPWISSKASRGECIWVSSSIGGGQRILGFWYHRSDLRLHLPTAVFPLCLCVCVCVFHSY